MTLPLISSLSSGTIIERVSEILWIAILFTIGEYKKIGSIETPFTSRVSTESKGDM
jgi:hypothetical protein